ncbi:unnamed protein product [Cyprideis torosa]|uniref:Uncharacterized protein n=1 Tax=Cyprideis torosa TaxID=163714 RepID=A0A7R8ZGI6_9CRUS|nr:unnamed protein product [Cyprideis torosa]CAG0881735.1 unnamed protein product [Cyprideis torosa]
MSLYHGKEVGLTRELKSLFGGGNFSATSRSAKLIIALYLYIDIAIMGAPVIDPEPDCTQCGVQQREAMQSCFLLGNTEPASDDEAPGPLRTPLREFRTLSTLASHKGGCPIDRCGAQLSGAQSSNTPPLPSPLVRLCSTLTPAPNIKNVVRQLEEDSPSFPSPE